MELAISISLLSNMTGIGRVGSDNEGGVSSISRVFCAFTDKPDLARVDAMIVSDFVTLTNASRIEEAEEKSVLSSAKRSSVDSN